MADSANARFTFDYLNRYYSRISGVSLGHSGCYGCTDANSPEEALAFALKRADESRKIMGFPMEVETTVTFRRNL